MKLNTVLSRLSDPLGTKACLDRYVIDNQINIHEIDKNSYFVFTSNLPLRRSIVKALINSYFIFNYNIAINVLIVVFDLKLFG